MTLAGICRTRPGKRPCRNGDCPSMTYRSPTGQWCVICHDGQFDTCAGCASLRGWCRCAEIAQEEAAREMEQARREARP